MSRFTTTKILGVRIVAQEHFQPTLFGPPIVSIEYMLVDWDTEQSVCDKRFKTLADAEKEICQLLAPVLSRMAWEQAEKQEGEIA
jgi:hypothetical protein